MPHQHFRTAVLSTGVILAAAAGTAAETGAARDILLSYASFDPLAGEPAIPEPLRQAAGSRVRLVQFHAPMTAVDLQGLQASGIEVLRLVPPNACVVRVPSEGSRAAWLPAVRWAGDYHPAYRLDSMARSELLLDSPEHGPVRYSIEAFAQGPEAQGRIASRIRALGGIVDLTTPDGCRMEATLTRDQLLAVAQLDDVNFIDIPGPPGADMDLARQLVGAVPVLSNAGFTGQGVRGAVVDTGLDVNHPAFQNPPPLVYCEGSASQVHGSAVYGIIFGNGAGDPMATGLLPNREQGLFCYYGAESTFGGPTSPFEMFAVLTDPQGPYRAVFQSRAVGSPQTQNYTTISAMFDAASFAYDLLICQAQGYEAMPSSRPQAWSKNLVSVGGVMHANTLTRADDTGGLSSAASDGRVKPDLAGIRDGIYTTAAGGSGYFQFSGTSAATGIVSGCFGLVFQMWHEGVWPGFGGGSSVFDSKPRQSTARALVINSAFQYDWTAGGPNASITRRAQGWGMPDLEMLYAGRDRTFIVNETDPLLPGQTRAYSLTVEPGTPVFKATMVYLDPAGNPAAAYARINDLTLRVTAPDQTVYWGNAGLLQGIWSIPGGDPDERNVIENVFIPDPAPGVWTVEVIGSQILQDARLETPELDADFALVVTGVTPFCYANCDGSTAAPVLNVNDFVCFQQRFAGNDPYANCDGSTVAPVLNVNDFVCFQQRFASGCQ